MGLCAALEWAGCSDLIILGKAARPGGISCGNPYLRSVTHFKFVFVGPDQKMVTKRPSSLSTELIVGAFCTIFRARTVGTGLGAKFGRKPAKTNYKL